MDNGPELPDVVSFIRAHLAGDEEACRSLLATAGGPGGLTLLSHVVTVAIDGWCQALPGGRDELERMLTSWQERRRGSL